MSACANPSPYGMLWDVTDLRDGRVQVDLVGPRGEIVLTGKHEDAETLKSFMLSRVPAEVRSPNAPAWWGSVAA